MNQVFFEFKRAHFSSLRIAREVTAPAGLTPARFDLLYALLPRGPLRQSKLRRKLGVAASTVSRMLSALERLGLVAREADADDTRQRLVSLTPRAVALVRSFFESAIDSDLVQLAVDSALAVPLGAAKLADFRTDYLLIESVELMCRRYRRVFRDVATLYYPYHPDD